VAHFTKFKIKNPEWPKASGIIFSLENNLLFNGDEAIISIFIAFCKLQAYDGFIGE